MAGWKRWFFSLGTEAELWRVTFRFGDYTEYIRIYTDIGSAFAEE